jgi:hypothetical protein
MRASGDAFQEMSGARSRLRLTFVAILAIAATGCAGFNFGTGSKGIDVEAPKISIAEVRLAEMPSNKELASYYCAQYLGPLICRVFGPVSSISDIHFAFDVELAFQNPNPVPLPIVQSLFAFTAFPEQSSSGNLGTVCLSFCEDPDHCTQDANACVADDPEIRDGKDFARAATDFLFAVALGERRFSDLRVRTVPPNDETRMVVRLGIDPQQMVELIARLTKGDIDRIKQGRLPELAIPYRIEGTAWVAVEGFGRLATGFGPANGQWRLQ